MISAPLQGLFIQPRRGNDPRVAKTDDTSLAVGSDGILYKMLEQRDWEKYRTLSDHELREELNKSREIKENMYTLNGKLKSGKYGMSSGSKIKLVAPQFGTQSRSRKIEKRNWEQDLNTLKDGGGSASLLKTNSDYHKTMATLVQNQQLKDGTLQETEPLPRRSAPQFRPEDGGLNVTQSAEDRIHAAINVMKDKYEQNLHVVEKLFDEKKYMERKIQLLEERLRRKVHREGPELDEQDYTEDEQLDPRYDEDEVDLDDPRLYATYEAPPAYDDVADEPRASAARSSILLKHSEYEPAANKRGSGYDKHDKRTAATGSKPAKTSAVTRASRAAEDHDGEYSAAELATMLNSPSEPSGPPPRHRYSTERSQSAPGRRHAPAPVADSTDSVDILRQSRSTHRATRPASASGEHGGRCSAARSATPVGMRSSSVGSRGSVSANLQADADRYIQKRRMLEEQEKAKRLEDERYEQHLRERYLKASMNGKEFTEMRKRQEAAEQQNKIRREKFLLKQQELEDAQRRERKAKLEANKQSMTMVTKNQLTWRELQEIEEAKRRDRIERRKQELAQISALPSSIAENLQKTRREAPVDTRAVSVGEFKAEDPAKVSAKLAHAQKIWDLKMDRERQRIKERHDTKILAATAHLSATGDGESSNYFGKSAMEVRTEQYARKREAKLREQKEREEQEAKRLKEIEDKKREKLLNTKVPIGKPTNSAILKAEKVRNDKQKEQDEERRMRAMIRKKEIASKEASAVLSVIIAEREHELRGSRGGHLEVRPTRDQEKAAEAREQYREQLRANKKRIDDSLLNRKCLIERHDTSIATKNAKEAALQKFAGAVGAGGSGSGGGTGRSSNHSSGKHGSGKSGTRDHGIDNLDLFDAKEQVRLGLKSL